MRRNLLRSVALMMTAALVVPPPIFAESPPPASETEVSTFNTEQLDALLAPIALYPDTLLVQVLMACTFPLQVVDASRWVEQPANRDLKPDALAKALEKQSWDPSVKSLLPFPQVLATLNSKLDWMQQVGYAFATQQSDVMDSVQRLRRQAQTSGNLKTTEQQRVVLEKEAIIIEPANPKVVYVPAYNPTMVYGAWPYPAYPPIHLPPPPGYVAGNALAAGMAFATGAAVVGSLWGWASPAWYRGNVNVNVDRYNSITLNQRALSSNVWRPPAGGVGGMPVRPPNGPVGAPARSVPLPANAIGRPSVQVAGSLVNGKAGGATQRPGSAGATSRPGNAGTAQRPGSTTSRSGPIGNGPRSGSSNAAAVQRAGNMAGASRPGGAGTPSRPAGVGAGPATRAAATGRPANGGAFGGIGEGARAAQFANRGAQSRQIDQRLTGRATMQGRRGLRGR